MDHGLVSEDGEEAGGESEDVDEGEDCGAQEELLLLRFQLQGSQRESRARGEEIDGGGRSGVG